MPGSSYYIIGILILLLGFLYYKYKKIKSEKISIEKELSEKIKREEKLEETGRLIYNLNGEWKDTIFDKYLSWVKKTASFDLETFNMFCNPDEYIKKDRTHFYFHRNVYSLTHKFLPVKLVAYCKMVIPRDNGTITLVIADPHAEVRLEPFKLNISQQKIIELADRIIILHVDFNFDEYTYKVKKVQPTIYNKYDKVV